MYFTKDELNHQGTRHNEPLYIIIKCKDYMINKVSINNGLALNVLPSHVLDRLLADASHIWSDTMMAKVYNDSSV